MPAESSVLIIPEAEPITLLASNGDLPLLLRHAGPVVLIDLIYAELVADWKIRDFVAAHPDVFVIERTQVGRLVQETGTECRATDRNQLAAAAIADFFENGIQKYVEQGRQVTVLTERRSEWTTTVIRAPTNIKFIETNALSER